jgi:hypothetical protein
MSTLGAALLVNLLAWVATLLGCGVLYRRAGGGADRWFVALVRKKTAE